MQDKVKQELANAERQLREANEAATSALRRKREQLQADMERLEAEQRQRIADSRNEVHANNKKAVVAAIAQRQARKAAAAKEAADQLAAKQRASGPNHYKATNEAKDASAMIYFGKRKQVADTVPQEYT